MAECDISTARDEAELATMARIAAVCFCVPDERARQSVDLVGADDILMIRRAGEPIGGLYLLPFAPWFGSRAVPTMGSGAAGVAPQHRGPGKAKALMPAALPETRQGGAWLKAAGGVQCGADRCSPRAADLRPPAGDWRLGMFKKVRGRLDSTGRDEVDVACPGCQEAW